jgi:sugar/nucleoside kinase (ribokinase family)
MVYDTKTNAGYECEAISANVVDETGCGNAFCGAFAAALAQGATISEGLKRGSVAASIMLEHVGVPPCPDGALDEYRAEASRRAKLVHPVAFGLDEERHAFVDFDEYIP